MNNSKVPSSIEQIEAQIIDNNNKITELLKENEALCKQMGYAPPASNFAPTPRNRIHFPTKYVRTKNYYENKYRLSEFFSNKKVVNNVAYSFQMSDLYNFILNRFYVFGPLEAMIYKTAIINYVCIIESLIGQVFDDMHKFCGQCNKHNSCEFFMPKSNNFSVKLKAIEKTGILNLSSEQFSQIREYYQLRNHIHIYTTANKNAFNTKSFDRKHHNTIIKIMQAVTVSLYNDMLPATKTCYKTLNQGHNDSSI